MIVRVETEDVDAGTERHRLLVLWDDRAVRDRKDDLWAPMWVVMAWVTDARVARVETVATRWWYDADLQRWRHPYVSMGVERVYAGWRFDLATRRLRLVAAETPGCHPSRFERVELARLLDRELPTRAAARPRAGRAVRR